MIFAAALLVPLLSCKSPSLVGVKVSFLSAAVFALTNSTPLKFGVSTVAKVNVLGVL